MFLQATVDAGSLIDVHRLIDAYTPHGDAIDYIEIGAPVITHFGIECLYHFVASGVPVEKIYADLKMIDFPHLEATPWIKRGVKRISAMAVMNDGAFRQLKTLADINDLTVFISTMGYPLSCLVDRVAQLRNIGFEYFICHGAGVTTEEAFEDMCRYAERLKFAGVKLIGAGGIGVGNAHALTTYDFAGLIVGRGLLNTEDVSAAVKTIKELATP